MHGDGTGANDARTLASASGYPDYPTATWNGTSYSVAFVDAQYDINYVYDGDIKARRIAADGMPLGDDAIVVASGPQLQNAPSMASDGAGDVLAFSDSAFTSGENGAVRALVLRNNDTLAPIEGAHADGVVSLGGADQDRIAAVETSNETIVAWRELDTTRSLHIGRLPKTGGWLEGATLAANPSLGPALASSGDVHLVAWLEGNRIFFVRFDRNLALLDATPIDCGSIGGQYPSGITAVWDGRRFVIVAGADHSLMAMRIDRDGHLLDFAPWVLRPSIDGDAPYSPAAFSNGETTVITYQRSAGCRDACIADLRIESMSLDDPKPHTIMDDNGAGAPNVSWNGQNFIVVWTSISRVRASLLDRRGIPAASKPVEFYPVDFVQRVSNAAVTWNGHAFELIFAHQTERIDNAATGIAGELSSAALPIGEFARHQSTDAFDRPAAAGAFLFYTTRINEAPYFGAKRIVVTGEAMSTLDPPIISGVTSQAINWTSPDARAEGFRIEAREPNGVYREIAHVGRDVRSATLDVRAGTMIRLRAWSASGLSPYSNEVMSAPPKRRATNS